MGIDVFTSGFLGKLWSFSVHSTGFYDCVSISGSVIVYAARYGLFVNFVVNAGDNGYGSAQLSITQFECFPTRLLSGARLYNTGMASFRVLCLCPLFILELTFRSSFVFRDSSWFCWPGSRLTTGMTPLSPLYTNLVDLLAVLYHNPSVQGYYLSSNPDPSLYSVLAGVAGSRGFARVTITPFSGSSVSVLLPHSDSWLHLLACCLSTVSSSSLCVRRFTSNP